MKWELSDKQFEKLQKWVEAKEPKYCGAIGGRWTYSMTPTNVGMIMKVTDNHPSSNNDTIDLTEYDEW